ncbi:uncharacterized protein LOC143883101 [Tasmannia lanceolata]|uniref:uncharacterized protein LOC143883101 n=1 Tax=Tasmannia lanceolata TaxID=3420 RepID=UPI004064B4DE
MESIKSMSKSVEKWISTIPKRNWASTYFEGSRYNMLTINVAESFNALLKDARELPIAALVEQTRWRLSDFFQYRQKAGSKWATRLTPNAEDWLANERILAGGYMAHQCGWTEYEVKSKYHVDEADLEKKTCTCRLFQTMGMPYSHAIAAMELDQRDPYSYCEEWYHADTYRRTYDGVIYPTLDRSQWLEPTHPLPLILPPKTRRQPGRPKKRRTERGMQRGVHHKCGTYSQLGHNKRSCKNLPIVIPQTKSPMIL